MAQPHQGSRLQSALDLVTKLCIIAAALTVVFVLASDYRRTNTTRPTRPADPVLPTHPVALLENAAVKGDPAASVVLGMFSDFECKYCANFAVGTWPALEKEYVATGKMAVAFHHFAISGHRLAPRAAAAAECARQQGQFWPMHDRMFRNQNRLGDADLLNGAADIGLNMPQFGGCLSRDTGQAIAADAMLATTLGVSATPTFFLGRVQGSDRQVLVTKRLRGALSFGEFQKVLAEFGALGTQ